MPYFELARTRGNESSVVSVWLAAFLDRAHIILMREGHRVDAEEKASPHTIDNLQSPRHETKHFSELSSQFRGYEAHSIGGVG